MTSTTSTTHSNVEMLRSIYADLTLLERHATDDMVLHEAERGMDASHYVGKRAAVDKELALIRQTGGTLVMDVQHVVANDHYGAVLGILRAHRGEQALAVPFCGLWRFRDGAIVEHWENAYDVDLVRDFLTEE